MATNIIMPALELAQETGKVLHWLKRPGDAVRKGEPIVEIETDKVTVEIEAPASGVLRDVTANEGDVVPVGPDDRGHCGGRGDRRCARHAARQRGGDRRPADAAGGGRATGRRREGVAARAKDRRAARRRSRRA